MVAFIPLCLLIRLCLHLASNVILFLINFHYSFFLLETDAAVHISCKAISPIPKLFHTHPLSFPFHESSNKKEFLEVTFKQQTEYYLINYLCPSLIPKHYFHFTFTFVDLSQTRYFVYHFRLRDFFAVFFKPKTVPPNGHFSNGKYYQAAYQQLMSQIYIKVTLYNLLL